MCTPIRHSFRAVWQLIAGAYLCLGFAVSTRDVHFGVWLPGRVPADLWALLWAVCAALTWQQQYSKARGAASVVPTAMCSASFLIDWVLMMIPGTEPFGRGAPTGVLAQGLMWAAVTAVVAQLTRMDDLND